MFRAPLRAVGAEALHAFMGEKGRPFQANASPHRVVAFPEPHSPCLFLWLGFFTFHFSLKAQPVLVFLALLLVSLLCAWHELSARMYYEHRLRPALQRLLTAPRLVCSQIAVIFTYGALIFLVGTLQVYFRQMIRYSWSMGSYVAAGLFLLFVFHHFIWLKNSTPTKPPRGEDKNPRFNCLRVVLSPSGELEVGRRSVLILFLLLLPQALMFYARVLYLYMPHANGGLGCSMQEIGFAQGTVGVIAFSVGLFRGGRLIRHYSLERLFWPLALSIVLSPFVYLGMTVWPPQSLWQLCLCTMTAQFLFGLGLSVCRLPISAISGVRYRNTINMLQIPLVSAALFIPMAISGWLVEQLGFDTYFLVNALCAPVCLLGVYLLVPTKHA